MAPFKLYLIFQTSHNILKLTEIYAMFSNILFFQISGSRGQIHFLGKTPPIAAFRPIVIGPSACVVVVVVVRTK